jgi:hypothetical protein
MDTRAASEGELDLVSLIVSPSRGEDGRKAYSTRGQLFDGEIGGRRIVTRSTTPFCDAARVLLGEGIDQTTPLVMRHAGAEHESLRSTVGGAARLTVRDTRGGKSVFAEHEPYDRAKVHRVSPPMQKTDQAAMVVAGRPKTPLRAAPNR